MSSAAASLGISYRRLDYWSRIGLLRATNEGGGSGTRRKWPEHELRIAALIARLADVGIDLNVAAHHARAAIDEGARTYYAHLAEGVYLSIVIDLD